MDHNNIRLEAATLVDTLGELAAPDELEEKGLTKRTVSDDAMKATRTSSSESEQCRWLGQLGSRRNGPAPHTFKRSVSLIFSLGWPGNTV